MVPCSSHVKFKKMIKHNRKCNDILYKLDINDKTKSYIRKKYITLNQY